ncbi:hypothetical protein ACLMJK_001961 [Lecanora helva]
MNEKPMNVLIVGGSLAGLMHGVMLRRLGHTVRILEQSPESILHGQAAGIRAGEEVREFFQKYDLLKERYFLDCPGLQFIDRDTKNLRFVDFPMAMTSWTTLYYRLRANFDGYISKHCPEPPEPEEMDGAATYDLGKRVNGVSYAGESVNVSYVDTLNGSSGSLQADLVIAADGSNSAVRQLLLPELQRPYAGYVAWRGSVLEKDASVITREAIKDNFMVFKMPRNYILVYTIPGPTGSLKPGERILNFVWYYNCPASSAEYASIMTDSDGHRHRNTLPPGKMRPEVWSKQKSYAQSELARPFAELVEKTTQPFISSVSDTIAPSASFFDGKLLLVGEALALFRPHIALSANQAAVDCLLLKKRLDGDITMKEWERRVLQYGARTRLLSIVSGNWTQFGGLKLVMSAIEYGMCLTKHKIVNMWAGIFG